MHQGLDRTNRSWLQVTGMISGPVCSSGCGYSLSRIRITIAQMARAGIFINLVGVILISAFFYVVGTTLFHIDLAAMSDWAVQSNISMTF